MEQEKYEAKLRFAKAFVELVSEMPIDKITVGQIVDRIGKSRKTFYYHFSDRNELVEWLFRYDIACELEKYFHRESLVFRAEGDSDHFAEMPFYVRNVLIDGTINNAMFFEIFSRSLEKHRDYYHKLFAYIGHDTLDGYLHKIYTPCLKEDIRYLLNRELSALDALKAGEIRRKMEQSSAIDFLAEFYTGAFISRVITRIHYAHENRTMHDIAPFDNVIHESIQLMIAKHIGELV